MIEPGVVLIWGESGSLKTSIGFTWPGRIEDFDIDQGAGRGWKCEELKAQGKLIVHRFNMPSRSLTTRYEKLEGYKESWASLTGLVDKACLDPEVRTVQLDTGTLVWGLCGDGFLQELQELQTLQGKAGPGGRSLRKQLIQIEYKEPNSRMKGLIQKPKEHGKWLVVVAHDTDEYVPVTVGGRPVLDQDGNAKTVSSGKKLPDCFKHTWALSDWVIHTKLTTGEDGKIVPTATVLKSGYNIRLVGMTFEWFSFDLLLGAVEVMA